MPGAWRECTRLENLQIIARGNQHPTDLMKMRRGLGPNAPKLLPRRPSPCWGKALGGPPARSGGPVGLYMTTGLHCAGGQGPSHSALQLQPLTQCLEQCGLQDDMCGSERTYSQTTDKDLGRAGQAKGEEEAGLTPSR